jgi:Aflatoxin regulatory protein
MDAVHFEGSGDMLDLGIFPSTMDEMNLPALDFSDFASNGNLLHQSLHPGHLATSEPPYMDNYSPPSNGSAAYGDSRNEKHSHHLNLAIGPGLQGDNCPQQAYEILGNLTGLHLIKDYSTPPATATRVPLDHVLRLNREASEQLGHLLACPCAKSANMALLHVSSIARILVLYQQAAACTLSRCQSPASDGSASPHVSPAVSTRYGSSSNSSSGSVSGSGIGLTMWSSAGTFTNRTSEKNTTDSAHSEISVTPAANVAIGSFSVDDRRAQVALKMQLILGEIRRASQLIDKFVASHGSGNQWPGDSVDNLYQSLDTWLRNEHSRVADMLKSKLRELNT